MPDSNCVYMPLSHLEAGDLLAALREWAGCVVEDEDRKRVENVFHKCEQSFDIVLVSRRSPMPVEPRRRSGLAGAPAGGVTEGGGMS